MGDCHQKLGSVSCFEPRQSSEPRSYGPKDAHGSFHAMHQKPRTQKVHGIMEPEKGRLRQGKPSLSPRLGPSKPDLRRQTPPCQGPRASGQVKTPTDRTALSGRPWRRSASLPTTSSRTSHTVRGLCAAALSVSLAPFARLR